MQKLDETVRRETAVVAVWVLVFSVGMEGIFLLSHAWDYRVLTGNLLGGAAAILNFLFLGITVQNALGESEKDAARIVRLSQSIRLLLLFGVAMIAALLPIFNLVSTLLPLLFPRFAFFFRPMLRLPMLDEGEDGR